MGFSHLARTAAVGLALGGATYAPLALVNADTAGAVPTPIGPDGYVNIVFTNNPAPYIEEYGAFCRPLEIHHVDTNLCVYQVRGSNSSHGPG